METQYVEINQEIADLVFNYIEALYQDDVKVFWGLISNKDKARVYGIYLALSKEGHIDESIFSFEDFIEREFQYEIRKNYERVKTNSGIASHLRFSEEGSPFVYLTSGVTEYEIIEEPTVKNVWPIYLDVDTNWNGTEVQGTWKVRIYEDHQYEL